MKHYYDTVFQTAAGGVVLPAVGVTVNVYLQSTLVAATIYSDDGLTIKTNPLTTDANGKFDFFVADGRYDIAFSGVGLTPFTQSNVEISDVTERTLAADATWNVGNANFSGVVGHSGIETFSATTNFNGDVLAKSGRPWYDVMAFGAKNDGATDDTAAIVAAMAAACARSPVGAIIYFPPGAGYKTANTGTTPFNVPCSNLHFLGTTWSQANSPQPSSTLVGATLTVPMFTVTGVNGILFENLGFSGNNASSGAQAISISGVNGIATLNRNFFDSWGGSAVVSTAAANAFVYLRDNWAQNCLLVRPATVDTGCFDIGTNDTQASGNFVTTSVGTAAGNIGAGHTYSWAIRGTNGFFTNNMGEISQHGWLVASTASFNTFVGNRSFLQQGNGYNVQGSNNIFTSNKAIASSQTATNSFSGFTISGGQNIFSDNIVEDGSLGNGNHTKNGFDDSTSAGATDFIGNKYSNNRVDAVVLGVLYNMTGTSPYAIQQPHRISADRGDANVTVQCGIDAETQYFNTPLTNTRTVTFSTTGAWNGCHFRIVRTVAASNGFPLATTAATGGNLNPGQQMDFEFNGTWQAVDSGVFATPASGNSVLVYAVDGRGTFTALSSAAPAATVASSTATMTTASISTLACGATVTVAATGVAATDTITWAFNAAPAANPGELVVSAWPTVNNVNFQYCNPTAGSVTPNAATLNWRVVR